MSNNHYAPRPTLRVEPSYMDACIQVYKDGGNWKEMVRNFCEADRNTFRNAINAYKGEQRVRQVQLNAAVAHKILSQILGETK